MVLDHFTLTGRGLALHEARRYVAALRCFERAAKLAPGCPMVSYNRANTMHMLGQDAAAELQLRQLLAFSLAALRAACPDCMPRSLQLDALFLLSQVVRHGRGPCAESVRLAKEHLRHRGRGIRSVWSARQVRAEIGVMQREMAAKRKQAKRR